MKILYVPAEEYARAETRDLDDNRTLLALQQLVEGWIESHQVPGVDHAVAVMNEDGVRLGLPPNLRASGLLRFTVHGPAAFFGYKRDGTEVNVPEKLLELARRDGILEH